MPDVVEDGGTKQLKSDYNMLIPSQILVKLLSWEMQEEIVKTKFNSKDNNIKIMNKRELKKDIFQLHIKINWIIC